MRPIAALLAVAASAALGADPPPPEIGFVERSTTRLAQIDVSVTGPPDVLDSLGKDDFVVSVGARDLGAFTLDRVCREGDAGPAPTFVFYLDHAHLTMAGRQNSLDILRAVIPRVVVGGARGSILSNAKELLTDAPFTTDAGTLLSAIDRIEDDLTRFDPWPATELDRVAKVLSLAGGRGEDLAARSVARRYEADERWRAERDLRRIESVLASLAEVPPPKALLYFGDTLRKNAGDHYESFFGAKTPNLADRGTPAQAFTRVVDRAAVNRIRFYTIEGQGLVAPTLGVRSPYSTQGPPNAERIRDSQATLSALALETGGEAFLNGVAAPRIAARVLDDLRCLYLVSFDPADFPRDVPLDVRVRVRRPEVDVRVRGRLVIPSESERMKSKLLASLAAPEMTENDVPIRVAVIPVGFRDGAFRARVQVAVPGIPVPGSTWELGASLVSRERVRDDVFRRGRVAKASVPVILEEEMSFGPGPYELVALAHEATTDQTSSKRLEGSFPDPGRDLAAVGPISVLQPAKGAFLSDGGEKSSGNLAVTEGDLARPELPTAILGIVCAAREARGAVRVERSLVGSEETRFPVQTLDLGTEPCAQILDVVPENTLGPGRYRYLVRVLDGTGEIARGERSVVAGTRGYPHPTP